MVEKLAADGADDSFGERVLPGRAWRSENLATARSSCFAGRITSLAVVCDSGAADCRSLIGPRDPGADGLRGATCGATAALHAPGPPITVR